MSGPCTDCGGPDYQTLEARIAELEAAANTTICIFCGATMEKDLAVMLDHAKGCELRPENRLMLQIAELEAERDALRTKWCGNCLSLQTCYIADKATELDDYEEQRVRCDFWAECEGGEG